MSHFDAIDALFAFVLWVAVACALGVLVGRIMRFGQHDQPTRDDNTNLVEVPRDRTRRDVKNGLGGGAA